jgi:hypothetical protein
MYQSDFKSRPRIDYNRSLSELRRGGRKLRKSHLEPEVIINHGKEEEGEEEEEQSVWKWFQNFAENTSIHGVKFTGQTDLHWSERCNFFLLK